ncbi:GWT1-domain-containing protein [Abortiporus biennis]|nr:GWT1-domain-containing protein [Abortiporus biennis]
MGDYKSTKEAFVSGMTGSSVAHVNLISLVSLTSVALYSSLLTRTSLIPSKTTTKPTQTTTVAFSVKVFTSQFIILIIPILLSVTFFANSPSILFSFLAFITVVIVFLGKRKEDFEDGHQRLPSPTTSAAGAKSKKEDEGKGRDGKGRERRIIPLPFLTTYRAHMLILTCISILAVDFQIFPRQLAKCEIWGVSLMDLGVGSFVFSQGLVSALPIIKSPTYLTEPIIPKLTYTLRKCFPVLLLGLLRVISVKGTEYPEHETEYGTHWNFFITLGLLPILQIFFHPLIIWLPISFLGVIVAISHQIVLSSYGLNLTQYVLAEPRTSIISSNKEGLVSLFGYLSIHLLGLSTGTLILPPTPSYFKRIQKKLQRSSFRTSSSSPSLSSSSNNSSSSASINTSSSHYPAPSSSVSGNSLRLDVNGLGGGRGVSSASASATGYRSRSPISPNLSPISRSPSFGNVGLPSVRVVDDGAEENVEERQVREGGHISPTPTPPLSPTSPISPSGPYSQVEGEEADDDEQEPLNDKRENDRTAIELCSYSIVYWSLFWVCVWIGVGRPSSLTTDGVNPGGAAGSVVSRRLVNLPYILYTTSFNTTFLLGYLLLDLFFFPSPLLKSVYSPRSKLKVIHHHGGRKSNVGRRRESGEETIDGGDGREDVEITNWTGSSPELFEAVNKNGLVLFLLANILTGLINLSIKTMYVQDYMAFLILVGYTFVVVGLAWCFRGRKIWRF